MKTLRRLLLLFLLVGLAGIGFLAASNGYYGSDGGERCGRCHEIRPMVDSWASSSHGEITCAQCHGSSLTADLDTHVEFLRRWLRHRRGESPEQIRVKHTAVGPLVARCAGCHAEQHKAWKEGPHAVTYSRLFLDKTHNSEQKLMEDCLRCHGMHYDGGIRALISPLDRKGPWQLIDARMYDEPAIPCLTCHSLHGEDRPGPGDGGSLAFYDRRVGGAVPAGDLPLPAMKADGRFVDVSTDERQALCYQCHAPRAGFQVGSGDDRTPTGVHEGLSCLDCHGTHDTSARASCVTCHAEGSPHCGLDVATMNTTFRYPDSLNDIHRVSCEDCHSSGRPSGRSPAGDRPAAFD